VRRRLTQPVLIGSEPLPAPARPSLGQLASCHLLQYRPLVCHPFRWPEPLLEGNAGHWEGWHVTDSECHVLELTPLIEERQRCDARAVPLPCQHEHVVSPCQCTADPCSDALGVRGWSGVPLHL
jgi:hypothetical protein